MHSIQKTFAKQDAGNTKPIAGQLSCLSMGMCIVLQCFTSAAHMHVAYEAFMTILPFKFPTTLFFMAWRSGCGECSNTSCCLRVCLFCFSCSFQYLCSISVCVLLSTSRSVFEFAVCLSYLYPFFCFLFSCSSFFVSVSLVRSSRPSPPLVPSLLLLLCLCIAPSPFLFVSALRFPVSPPYPVSVSAPVYSNVHMHGQPDSCCRDMCRSRAHSAAIGLSHYSNRTAQEGVQDGRPNVLKEVAARGERWHITCNPIPKPCVLVAWTQELETDMFNKKNTGGEKDRMKENLVLQIRGRTYL